MSEAPLLARLVYAEAPRNTVCPVDRTTRACALRGDRRGDATIARGSSVTQDIHGYTRRCTLRVRGVVESIYSGLQSALSPEAGRIKASLFALRAILCEKLPCLRKFQSRGNYFLFHPLFPALFRLDRSSNVTFQ